MRAASTAANDQAGAPARAEAHANRTARAPVIAIVGPGEQATAGHQRIAEELGALCADAGWVVVTGGRASGVMAAASRGARGAGGVVLGILPGRDPAEASPDCDLVVPSGLGEARNALVVLTASAVIACGMNPGTASEAALALALRRPLILVGPDGVAAEFFVGMGGSLVSVVETAREAVDAVRAQLGI